MNMHQRTHQRWWHFASSIGIIGMIGMGVNLPIYKKLLEKGKQKYAFEIIQLAKEISDK